MDVHFTVNAEKVKIFTDGTIFGTGPLVATYSAIGKSVTPLWVRKGIPGTRVQCR